MKWGLKNQIRGLMLVIVSGQSMVALAQTAKEPDDEALYCRDTAKPRLLRAFDLRADTSCPSLTLRGWQPTNLSVLFANSADTVPSTPSPGHTAAYQAYQDHETRIQVSVRTKLGRDLFRQNDSIWFGYTSQSSWQMFNAALSRPFRTTDHEPEAYYIYPLDVSSEAGWHWRYGGTGLVHHSNGQSLPLSRSWNRAYLMAGWENIVATKTRLSLQARAWQRLPEASQSDDNPDIIRYMGRAELQARWYLAEKYIIGVRVRHALDVPDSGSVQLDFQRKLSESSKSSMYSHISLFSGYGDTLIDYNRKRVILRIGISLLDW